MVNIATTNVTIYCEQMYCVWGVRDGGVEEGAGGRGGGAEE